MRSPTLLPGRILAALLLAAPILIAIPALAQTAPAPAVPPPMSHPAAARARHQTPGKRKLCWQEAGVSQSVMDKVTGIHQNMRTQVTSVCSDTSLSHEQKLDKVAEVQKSGRDQIDALIPQHQRDAIQSCQRARSSPPRRRRRRARTPDPCGPIAATPPAATDLDAPENPAPPDNGPAPEKPTPPGKPADGKETGATAPKDGPTESRN